MVHLTCDCGAVYEAIETTGPCHEDGSFKCLVCEKELLTWTGSGVAQFRLIKQPESDRE